MSDVVRYETEGEIAIVTVNYPPVNALSHAVRSGIIDGINKANADDAVNFSHAKARRLPAGRS